MGDLHIQQPSDLLRVFSFQTGRELGGYRNHNPTIVKVDEHLIVLARELRGAPMSNRWLGRDPQSVIAMFR